MFFVHVLFLSCIDDLVFLTDVLSIRSFFYFEQTDVAIVTCLGVFFTLEGGNRKRGAHMRIINKFVDWICALFLLYFAPHRMQIGLISKVFLIYTFT